MSVRRLARSVEVDVSLDGSSWVRLPGKVDISPQITPNKVDSTDTDSDGFTSTEITLQSAQIVVKWNSLATAGVPDTAQQLVEATQGEFGDDARLYVRYFDSDGGSRGYSYRAVVGVQYSKTGVPDLREVTATFDSDGTVTKLSQGSIDALVAALADAPDPVITSALPSAVAVGGQVTITGTSFTGTTGAAGVKFGGTNATSYVVVSDTKIVAVMPAGSAGSAVVLVTSPAGASNSLAYTRGA